MKDIAFVCSKCDDRISKSDVYYYFESGPDKYDRDFIDLCIGFGLKLGWLLMSDENRYTLTTAGREFISRELGTDKKETKK